MQTSRSMSPAERDQIVRRTIRSTATLCKNEPDFEERALGNMNAMDRPGGILGVHPVLVRIGATNRKL
jgi:hypothetical protein